MIEELLARTEVRLGTALVIGLMVGAERQQRIAEGGHSSAGIRTFALTALLGGVAVALGGWAPLVLFGAAVSAAVVVAYAKGSGADPGLTTEIAIVLAYALGALAMAEPQLALGLGIVVAVILAFRERIHEAVSQTITPTELRDVLLFAASALVILPLLPNEPVDPLGAVKPFVVWRLAVVVMGVMLAAHIARRILGERWGILVAGLASGFVSSSATVAAMGAKAKETPARGRAYLAAGAASSVATFVLMAVLVGTASPPLLVAIGPPLLAGGVAALAFAAWYGLTPDGGEQAASAEVSEPDRSSLRVRDAVLFALVVSVVTWLAGVVEASAGAAGVLVGSAVAAFADSHAAGASLAAVHATDHLAEIPAMLGILICLTTNGVTKTGLAFSSGTRGYAVRILFGQVLALGAAWLVLSALLLLG